MPDPDLLGELDAATLCWCGCTPEECEESGGCRWTRELVEARRQERQRIAEEVIGMAAAYRKAGTQSTTVGAQHAGARKADELEALAKHIIQGGPDAHR